MTPVPPILAPPTKSVAKPTEPRAAPAAPAGGGFPVALLLAALAQGGAPSKPAPAEATAGPVGREHDTDHPAIGSAAADDGAIATAPVAQGRRAPVVAAASRSAVPMPPRAASPPQTPRAAHPSRSSADGAERAERGIDSPLLEPAAIPDSPRPPEAQEPVVAGGREIAGPPEFAPPPAVITAAPAEFAPAPPAPVAAPPRSSPPPPERPVASVEPSRASFHRRAPGSADSGEPAAAPHEGRSFGQSAAAVPQIARRIVPEVAGAERAAGPSPPEPREALDGRTRLLSITRLPAGPGDPPPLRSPAADATPATPSPAHDSLRPLAPAPDLRRPQPRVPDSPDRERPVRPHAAFDAALAERPSAGATSASAPAPAEAVSRAAATPAEALAASARGTDAATTRSLDHPARRASIDGVTLRFEGEDGVEGRLRVAVRGSTVRATIVAADPASVERLEARLAELHRSLAERGFREAQVVVQRAGGPPETRGVADSRGEFGARDESPGRDDESRRHGARSDAGDPNDPRDPHSRRRNPRRGPER